MRGTQSQENHIYVRKLHVIALPARREEMKTFFFLIVDIRTSSCVFNSIFIKSGPSDGLI